VSRYAMIAVGGALGAIARYVLGGLVQEWAGARFPYGTLVINVTGCLVMGVVMTLLTERGVVHPNWRFLVPVGFIGAYTTFSTFEYETFRAIEQGAWLVGLGNVIVSVVIGFISVAVGVMVTRQLLMVAR
jgi:fluoride exporter